MSITLRHILNPTFALVFAVGVDRVYRLLDHQPSATDLLKTGRSLWWPLTMIGFTLVVGFLAAVTNDRFVEARPSESPRSLTACLAYATIVCILVMFYFAVDDRAAGCWLLAYAALCLLNAIWNGVAPLEFEQKRRHITVNFILCVLLILLLFAWPGISTNAWGFYITILVIVAAKWWQHRQHREFRPPEKSSPSLAR